MDYKELECIKKLNELVDECISEKEAKNVLSYKPKSLTELYLNNIQNTIKKLEDENRLLQIGIVGAVKAGKSTFLNSLIFDGKDVLPKAATPMTAALTIIKYGEFGARVELFSDNDITIIKNKALDSNDKDNPSKQQYEKIKNSNIKDISQIPTEIKADSFDELNEKLKEYVGADGKYTPFVKHVELSLKDEKLKDIQIVDTPGINDPVTSREEVTKKELQNCDVVFILSTATQFLSNADLELLNRISHKEGIREVYFVASMFDDALNSMSVVRKSGNDLAEAKKNEMKNLKTVIDKNISYSEILSEEIKKELVKNELLFSSGLAYTIAKKLKENQELNSEEITNIEAFKENYSTFFNDDILQMQYDNLHGVDKIKMALENVRQNKDKIKKDKISNMLLGIQNKLEDYIKNEIKELGDILDDLDCEEVEDLKDKIQKMEDIKNKTAENIQCDYEEEVHGLIEGFSRNLKDKFDDAYNVCQETIRSATENYYKEGWIWDDDYLKIDGSKVSYALDDLMGYINKDLNKYIESDFSNFRSKICCTIISTLETSIEEARFLDDRKIKKAAREILEDIKPPKFKVALPYTNAYKYDLDNIVFFGIMEIFVKASYGHFNYSSFLKKPYQLTKKDAISYKADVDEYLNFLDESITDRIDKSSEEVKKAMLEKKVAKDVIAKYIKEVDNLKSDLQNKEQSMEFIKKYQYKFRELRSLI